MEPEPPSHLDEAASDTSFLARRPTLVASGIIRRYGSAVALRGVDLTLRPGEIVALFGPNGAGKTTLIRVLATLLRPHGGSFVVNDVDAVRSPTPVRRWLGVLGHQTCLYGDLTPAENLQFYARLYGVDEVASRIAAVLAEVDMTRRADVPVRTLSRGMQQRVGLARAILHQPSVLLLDEPETGLDDDAQERLGGLIRRQAASGGSVLFTSHRLDWAARLADRAIVLRGGRITAEIGPPLAGAEELVDAYRDSAQLALASGGASW